MSDPFHFRMVISLTGVRLADNGLRTGDQNLLDQPEDFDPDALRLKSWAQGQLQCAADLAQYYARPEHKHVVFFISTGQLDKPEV